MIKKIRKFLPVVIVIFFCSPTFIRIVHATTVSTNTLVQEINKILSNSALKNTKIGIKIVSLKTGETLFEKNPNTLLIPASNAKILTAAATLKQFGPQYKFSTTVFYTGTMKEGKIHGDLYIKGNGDTFFVTEMIYYFSNELATLGLKEISGDIVIDDFYFDRNYDVPPGDRAYVAPVSAVAVNFNSIAVSIQPGNSKGTAARAVIDPPNTFIDLKNNAITGGKNSSISVSRKAEEDKNSLFVSGSVPLGSREKKFYRSISSPPLYAGAVLKSIFLQRGIKIFGSVKHKETPANAKEFYKYESKSFDLIIKDLMNFSNNMIANQLIKALGAYKFGAPGSMEKGLRAAKESLSTLGIDPESFRMVDGSGYDRQNKVSAATLAEILKKMSEDLILFPGFWFSLPVAGEEGTLARRFKSNQAKGKIRAKTGTITGVATLAGYAPTLDGELLAFSIMINDPRGRTRELYSYQDKIGELLCSFTRRQ